MDTRHYSETLIFTISEYRAITSLTEHQAQDLATLTRGRRIDVLLSENLHACLRRTGIELQLLVNNYGDIASQHMRE